MHASHVSDTCVTCHRCTTCREGDKRLLALLTHFQKHPPPVERRAAGEGGQAGWASRVVERAVEALREAPGGSGGQAAPALLLLFTRVTPVGAPAWMETLQTALPPWVSLACVDVSPVAQGAGGGRDSAPPPQGLRHVIPLASMTLLPPSMDVPALLHLATQHAGGDAAWAVCDCCVAASDGGAAALGDAELTHCAWLGQQQGRLTVTLTAAVASEAVLPLPRHLPAQHACLRAHPDSAMAAALHMLCCAGAAASVSLTCGQAEVRAVLVPVTHCAALLLPCTQHPVVPSSTAAGHAVRGMYLERHPVCFAAAPGLLAPRGARADAAQAPSTPWPGVASALAAAHAAASKDDIQPAHWRAAMHTTSSRALDRAMGDLAQLLRSCCPPTQQERTSSPLAERARSRAAALRALPVPAPARVFEGVDVVVADCVTRHGAYLATQEASCPPCGEFVKELVTDILRRVEPRHASEALSAVRAALPLTDVQLRATPCTSEHKRRRNTLAATLLLALLLRVPDGEAAGEEVPTLAEPVDPRRVANQVTKVLAPCGLLLQPVGAEGMTNFCGTHIVPHFGGCAPETVKCLYRILGIGHPFGQPAQDAPAPDAAPAPEQPAAAAPDAAAHAADGADKGGQKGKGRPAAPRAAAPKAPKAVTAREAAALAMKRKATTRPTGRAEQGAKGQRGRGGLPPHAHMSSQPSTGGVGARSPAHAVRRAGRGAASPAHGGARRALLTRQEQEEQEGGPASHQEGSPSDDFVVPQTAVKRTRQSDVVPMSPAGARRAPNARLFHDVMAASPVRPAKRGAADADLVPATVAKRQRTSHAEPPPPQQPIEQRGGRRSSGAHHHGAAWDAAAKAHAMAALTALSCMRREQQRGECVFVAAAFEEVPDDVLFPDYYTQIAAPVSLASLRWGLHSDAFATRSDFLAAVERMFTNAQTYNAPQSQPHVDADTLRTLFTAQMDAPIQEHASAQTQVGRRLRVWWSADGEYFPATVLCHAPQRGQVCYFVRYDDGFSEWLDVEDPQWRIQWDGDGERPRRSSRGRKDSQPRPDAVPPTNAAAGSADWGQPADLLLALRRRSGNA
jgi:hypothetical protein